MGKATAALPAREAEKRRPEQHTGDHFRHDLRLAEPGSDGTHETTEHEDDSELEEELNGEVQVIHWCCRPALTTMRYSEDVKTKYKPKTIIGRPIVANPILLKEWMPKRPGVAHGKSTCWTDCIWN